MYCKYNKMKQKIFSRVQIVVVYSLSRVQLFCDPIGCSFPDSSVHAISQVRTLEEVAISFSRGIFFTQGSNLSLPLSHQGSPKSANKPPQKRQEL